MSRLKGAPIRVGVAMVLLASVFSSAAQSQQFATSTTDADSGSSYTLRKSTLWFNRYVQDRGVYGAAYADFNKDGFIDAAIAPVDFSGVREPVRFMINTGGGNFANQTATVLSNAQPGVVHARKILTGDFNSDGWPDVFVAGHGYDQPPFPGEFPHLFLSNGNGTLRYDNSLESQISFNHGAASGDINHDYNPDLLIVQQHHAHFLINDGLGHFTKDNTRLPAEVEWKNYFTGELIDIDKDGYIDVVLGGHEYEGAATTIYWGNATRRYTSDSKTVLPGLASWAIVNDYAAEDIDGDGDRDMILNRTGQTPFYTGRYLQVLMQSAPRVFVDETSSRLNMNTDRFWTDYIRVQDINGDQIVDLFLDEKNESFNGEYAWTNNGQGVFTNYTGDVKPSPTLSVTDAAIFEDSDGIKKLSFDINSSQPLIYPVTFDVYTNNGTAVAGRDYQAAALEGVTIAPQSSSATFEVTINDDAEVEGNEGFTVNLANVSGAMLADAQGVGRILNDDLPVVSIADASIVEGDIGQSTLRFLLSLSAPSPDPVRFQIATISDSAFSGTDFVFRVQNARVIDPGRTRQVFEVNVLGDTLAEADETFNVLLNNVTGAIVGDISATGTIVNDDAPAVTAPTTQVAGNRAAGPIPSLATPAEESACRMLERDIARAEQRVASGKLSEQRGIAHILNVERERARLGCI